MAQIKLFITTTKELSGLYFERADAAFEEAGFPIATRAMDDQENVYQLEVYIEESDLPSVRTQLAQLLNINESCVHIERLPDVDWVKHSLAGLTPVRAGRFFVHGSHDRYKVQENDLAIEIEANQAFGTGHHGTTAGCLTLIDKVVPFRRPRTVLDLGTGSGVLAIAIARLAPTAKIIATDIDPTATKIAQENAQLNGVSPSVVIQTAKGLDHPVITDYAPFDMIVANILANPLMELAPAIATNLSTNGFVLLSGVLDSQHDQVVNVYLDLGLHHQETLHREGWVTILLEK